MLKTCAPFLTKTLVVVRFIVMSFAVKKFGTFWNKPLSPVDYLGKTP
jgi:hypothetical protein